METFETFTLNDIKKQQANLDIIHEVRKIDAIEMEETHDKTAQQMVKYKNNGICTGIDLVSWDVIVTVAYLLYTSGEAFSRFMIGVSMIANFNPILASLI